MTTRALTWTGSVPLPVGQSTGSIAERTPYYPIGTGGGSSSKDLISIVGAIFTPFEEGRDEQLSLREDIAFSCHYLSLSISELAEIAGVQRPTIYSWMKEESHPRRANLERLQRISWAARQWKELSGHPIGRMKDALIADREASLVDLLRASAPKEDIRNLLHELDALASRPRYRSIRERLESRGIEDSSESSRAQGRMRAARHVSRKSGK